MTRALTVLFLLASFSSRGAVLPPKQFSYALTWEHSGFNEATGGMVGSFIIWHKTNLNQLEWQVLVEDVLPWLRMYRFTNSNPNLFLTMSSCN